MIRAKANISDDLRRAGVFQTTGPNSIYRKAGSQLRDKVISEFKDLVIETPQWTGTTAASWEIGFSGDITGSVEEQPERTKEQALQRGSQPACDIAIANAERSFTESDLRHYAKEDLLVSNTAPGYDTAEEGPVRQVNTPPGALKRFESRIAALDFEVDFYKVGK